MSEISVRVRRIFLLQHTQSCHFFNETYMFLFLVCKSCVVKFLQSNKHCPQCNIKIHETQPLLNLKADRVMQDIVFKLVPQLYEGITRSTCLFQTDISNCCQLLLEIRTCSSFLNAKKQ